MRAWLITWEWVGDHARVDDPIAAILNPRMSSERDRQIVEFIYVNSTYSLSERLQYANNRKFNPYPARFGLLEGLTWDGYIECGHNPWLFARKVSDLCTVIDDSDEVKFMWKDISAEEMKDLRLHAKSIKELRSA